MRIGMRTIKTVIGATLALLIANQLHLSAAPAAAIITILSVGNTRKSSWKTGFALMGSLVLATLTSFIVFSTIGHNALGFGLYLLLYIPFAVKFKFNPGISVSSVLVTHYLLAPTFTWGLVLNEFLLMAIGVGAALLMNSYMPDYSKQLKAEQAEIEEKMRLLLVQMAKYLTTARNGNLDNDCQALMTFVHVTQTKARTYYDNQLFNKRVYYQDYFAMRRSQISIMRDLTNLLRHIHFNPTQAQGVTRLLVFTANTFAEENDGTEILRKIETVYDEYRLLPLPENRAEFENRANLFQFLQMFKTFIEIKAEFSQSKTQKNKGPA
jgi:uncharacterized membrane protein YgaE (UPF0421/DUF939 family)